MPDIFSPRRRPTQSASSTPVNPPPPTNPELPASPEATSIGHSLLERYVHLIRAVVVHGSADQMIELFDELGGEAAREASKLGPELTRRYQRLLAVTIVMLTPDPDGEERPLVVEELEAFIAEVEGKPRKLDRKGGLAEIASALTEEVINLHLMLDGSSDREAAREIYFDNLGD